MSAGYLFLFFLCLFKGKNATAMKYRPLAKPQFEH